MLTIASIINWKGRLRLFLLMIICNVDFFKLLKVLLIFVCEINVHMVMRCMMINGRKYLVEYYVLM